jgi:hypothetical protein
MLRVFENRVLRKIFGPKRNEVTGEWRRLHNKELYALYSPNITRVITRRRINWTGHVAYMGDRKGGYRALWRDLKYRHHLINLGVYKRIILKWIFKKWHGA